MRWLLLFLATLWWLPRAEATSTAPTLADYPELVAELSAHNTPCHPGSLSGVLVRQNPWSTFDPEGLAQPRSSFIDSRYTRPPSWLDAVMPATMSAAAGGRSPYGGPREVAQASARVRTNLGIAAGAALAPYAVGTGIAAGSAVASSGAAIMHSSAVSSAAVGATLSPWTVPAVVGAGMAAETLQRTGDPVAALQDFVVGTLMGRGLAGPSPSARRTTAEAAQEVQNAQGSAVGRDKSTTAALAIQNAEGENLTLVGSSRGRLTPDQRAALAPGEIEVAGRPGEHAEIKVINEALRRGSKMLNLDPSRKFCPDCERVREALDIPTSTDTRPQPSSAKSAKEPH